ncbi:MAG TPA: ATP-binding protein [Opitutaceae bacterium]|nr:ATP-binding protein [Opitutaceae bacterium]
MTGFPAIWTLPDAEQHRAHPVRLDLRIYYYDPIWQAIWGSCGDVPGFISLGSHVFPIRAGARVRVTGMVTPAAGMVVANPVVAVLAPPAPLPAERADDDLGDTARFNNHFVSLEGLIDRVSARDPNHWEVRLACDGRTVWAEVLLKADETFALAPNTIVRAKGVYFARPQGEGAPPRLELWMQGPEQFAVLAELDRDARFNGAKTPAAALARVPAGRPVVMAGTVAVQEAGKFLLLRDATGLVRVESAQTQVLPPGATVEAIGFPVPTPAGWVLRRALYRAPLPLITSQQDIYDLPDSLRNEWYRVRFEYLVYDYDPVWHALWGRTGDRDQYLSLDLKGRMLRPGARIAVEGRMRPADGSTVFDATVTELGPPRALQPIDADGDFGATDRFAKKFVAVDGYVDQQSMTDASHVELELDIGGRPAIGRLFLPPGATVPDLDGAYVRVRGVYSATTNPTTGVARIELWIQSPDSVAVTGSIAHDARFNRPVTPIERVPASTPGALIRVRGVVRAQEPGLSLTLRDETGQIVLHTVQSQPISIGETVEAIGIPARRGSAWALDDALFRRSAHPVVFSDKSRLRVAEQVRDLQPEDAARNYPVLLTGVTTWANPAADFFFISDVSGGVCVYLPPHGPKLMAGMSVQVQGVTARGRFAPVVLADRVTWGGVVDLPDPRPVTLEQALTGVEEAQWVSMTGFVRAVVAEGPWSRFDLTTSAGEFTARLPASPSYAALAGSVVTVHGVCDAAVNDRRQLTGVQVWVQSRRFLQVDEPVPADPFRLPDRPIATLRQFNSLVSLNRRLHVSGVVVNWPRGGVAQLQDGSETLRVLSRLPLHFVPGDRIDAVGFAGRQNNRPVLRESVCRLIAHGPDPAPLALKGANPINLEYAGRLVRLEGRVLDSSTQERGIHLLLQSAGGRLEATLEDPGLSLPAEWARGSDVAVTGVYTIQFDDYRRPDALEVVMRSPADVRVLHRAPWWTEQRILALMGILAAALLSGIGWVVALRRRVRQQTAVIHEQVTKEKAARLEAALTRASKLESLGVLAGGIAHDFNNLLTVVMGNLSLAKLDARLTAETQSLLEQGVEAAKQARGLTQQLLTFAKGGEPVRRSESLTELVRESTAFALHGSKSGCDFDFGAAVWAADVDRTQIGQVIHNIVINADQAMPEGGRIHIALRNRVVAAGMVPGLPAGRYVELTIEDTGPGIPAEQLSRIFEPYFTTKAQGNGLGLATVHSIVKRHKGHIAVDSERGRGTTFRIWLPAAAAAQPEVPTPAEAPAARTGRVLFMDDEAPIRTIAATVLKKMGMEVMAVADGAAAVQAYEEALRAGQRFDVVILDLTVPGGMGGAAAMAEMQRLDPQVKAIASSGYSSDPVMANYAAYGFSAIVPKPYQVSDLMKAVSSLLRASPRPAAQPAAV